jgi:hypothetical protein
MTETPSNIQIECRQPKYGEPIRVKPDEAHDVVLVKDNDGIYYMIAPNMLETAKKKFPDKLEFVTIFFVVNDKEEFFMWPVPRPVPEDHPVHVAMKRWIAIELVHPMPEKMQ